MATCLQTVDRESVETANARDALIREVRRGLIARPRALASWMFYDAEGSRLFERITALPEYYPTRTERAILAEYAEAILARASGGNSLPLRIVELGAGSASKTCILLEAAVRVSKDVVYMPVDVCADALEVACQNVAGAFSKVRVNPIVRNYIAQPLELERFEGTTLALYMGTSIGNFSPEEARVILRNLRVQLRTADALLLGTDMAKNERVLLDAYDDRDGVTAAFNLNILQRINRELEANFDISRFRHRVLWNSDESRIEMHLESAVEQDICIPGAELDIRLQQSETIHTENSYKFTDQAVGTLLALSDFGTQETWKDPCGWYSLTLATANTKVLTIPSSNCPSQRLLF